MSRMPTRSLTEFFSTCSLVHLLEATRTGSMNTNLTQEHFMPELSRVGRRHHPQKRRYRRFSLHYPVNLKFDLGNSVSAVRAISNNISLGGVLLEADSAIPQHSKVSFIMTVRGHHIIGPTRIVGEGEVVRVERLSSGTGFAIAVECKRPISELQVYLPALASQEPSKTRNGRIPVPYPLQGDLN
jgi:hypothetical protein